MAIPPTIIRCEGCGQQLRVPADRLKQTGRCPTCGKEFGPVEEARRRIIGRLCLGYLALTTVLIAILHGWGDAWWFGTVLLFSPRWFLLVPWPVLASFAAWADRGWRTIGFLAATAVLLAFGWMNYRVDWRSDDWGAGDKLVTVRLVTCNADFGALRPDEFAGWVTSERADLVVLQDAKVHHLRPRLRSPEWEVSETQGGVALFSRWPIRSERGLPPRPPGNWGGAAVYTVEVHGAAVNVLVLHLPTPRDGLAAALALQSGAPGLIDDGIERRDTVAGEARALADSAGPPLIVAGDFNTPPESRVYRRHWGDLRNAFSMRGSGLGHTFFTRRNSTRVDHILTDSRWAVLECRVGPDLGSAHRPVIAELRLRGQ